ncbi:MAG TPA: serine hydrolase domain-containing protein [Clostridia bacterium]|nr:serine hydrolase domain-containing protein [Clostridia bacterium]
MSGVKAFSLLIIIAMLTNVTLVSGMNMTMGQKQATDNTSEFQKKLDSQVPDLLKKYGVPGVKIAVIEGDKVWEKEYGYADKSAKKLISANTIFQVGSVSKMVTAWGAMKLVDQGKINLDTPVEEYLTRWHLPKSQYNSEGVTLRRILSHTAGLSLQGYAGAAPSKKLVSIEESLSGRTYGAGDVRIIYEPGSRFQYSGGGYTLLQLMIEEVSGMPFEKYMEQEVLKPLGMNNSAFEWKDEFKANMSKAYGVLGQTLPNYLFTEKAAAGLFTTAADLAKFEMAVMNVSGEEPAGRGVVKPETVALMTTSVTNADWGLGYQMIDLPNGETAVGHGGTNRGWRAQLVEIPDKKQGLVILTNSDMGDNVIGEIAALWMEQQTGGLPDFYSNMHSMDRSTLMLAVILGFLFVAASMLVANSIMKGKRQYAYLKDKKMGKKILRILAPVLITAAWWIGLYGPIVRGWNVAGFLPASLKWVTLAVTLWCMLLLVIAVLPKKNKKKSVDNKLNIDS